MTAQKTTGYLKTIMTESRTRTLELLEGLDDQQLMGPRWDIVNPLRWEIGHVAWFHESFIVRRLDKTPPIWDRGDEIFDSIKIEHGVRWDLPLPTREESLKYMRDVEDANLARLSGNEAGEEDSFIYQFSTFHNDMHNEAYSYQRQTLSYPRPSFAVEAENEAEENAGPLPGDVEIPGGSFRLGAEKTDAFVFDNEKWAHDVLVQPFRIAKAPVTNEEFAAFVDDGGYARRELWPDAGWGWRVKEEAGHPVYWLKDGGRWMIRQFDEMTPLPPHQPVSHVNWYEAMAYCKWAGRRLPTELEWEVAASGEPDANGNLAGAKRLYPWGDDEPGPEHCNMDGRVTGTVDVAALPAGDSAWGCRQMMGNIWEWTTTQFDPFPGFAPDAYKEYSEPVFHTRKVLKGGAWATRSRMVNNRHRNFFTPERRDVLAGFRTCAREYDFDAIAMWG